MSSVIAQFDPNAKTSDTFTLNYLSNGIGKIVIWNDSPWSLDLTFPNGDTDIAPAWVTSIFEVKGPSGSVQWAQDRMANVQTPDLSNVWVVAYRDNENVPGVFPIALTRQTKSGGGSISSTSNTSIDNEGNPVGTSIIKSIVAGDGTNQAVSLTNDAVFILGDTANPGSMTAAGKITANGGLETSLLDSPVDHDSYIAVSGSGGTQNTRLQSGSVISMQIPGGATTWEFSGADFNNIGGGSIHLNIGQLKDINHGSGSFTAGTHVVNHGLSGTPAVVMGTCSDTSSTGTFSIYNYTSTQFTINNGSGITLDISWLAYR